MHFRKGDRVTASRELGEIDAAAVPEGTEGTVLETSLIGSPKLVAFVVNDMLGEKHIELLVDRGDVTKAR
jgi:hypothetical protein